MKAIMIVDIPDNCNRNLLFKTPVSIVFNYGTYKTLLYADGYLQPMPNEKEEKERIDYYDMGWNDCVRVLNNNYNLCKLG